MDLRTTYLFNLTFLRSKMPPEEEPLRSIQLKKSSSIFSCYYCPHSTASVFSRKFEKIPTLRSTKCHLWQSTRVAEKQSTTTATLRSLNYLSNNMHDRSSTDAVYLDYGKVFDSVPHVTSFGMLLYLQYVFILVSAPGLCLFFQTAHL